MEHKIIRHLPGKKLENQINHILISKKSRGIVDTKWLYRGVNTDTDYILVIAKIKIETMKDGNKQSKKIMGHGNIK